MDLLALVTLGGSLTVFRLEAKTASLKEVFYDGEAFSGAVVGVEEDSSNGDLVVISAGVGEDHCWVISRASSVVC